ncbi:MAG: response regulator transcription factor [Reyranella sp.]|nr:response regulator transcription factor [Reyranella sp.]GHV25807.1 DNA-binding response regulator [Spirochaetia bacterium]
MRVLIVEDNGQFAELVAQHLEQAGIDADWVETTQRAECAVGDRRYAAILLDLGLSDRDGLALLRDLRARGDVTPVLIMSARHGLEDRLRGLQEGADDYLAKPFAIDELIARLNAILRRQAGFGGEALSAGNVLLDTKRRTVSVGDRVLPMRLRETLVLELLMRKLGNVVSRKVLADGIFGVDGERAMNTLDVYVHRLRRQLLDAAASVLIHTVHGVGYMLTESHKDNPAHSKPSDARCA